MLDMWMAHKGKYLYIKLVPSLVALFSFALFCLFLFAYRFQDFCRYIQLFKYASIYRDRASGGLRGMSFLDVQPKSFHVDDSGKLHHCRVVKVK